MEDRHVARLDLLAAADAGPHLLQCNFFAVRPPTFWLTAVKAPHTESAHWNLLGTLTRGGVQVFDGHSGFDCAEVAAQQLPDLLSRQPQLTRNPCQALVGALPCCNIQMNLCSTHTGPCSMRDSTSCSPWLTSMLHRSHLAVSLRSIKHCLMVWP